MINRIVLSKKEWWLITITKISVFIFLFILSSPIHAQPQKNIDAFQLLHQVESSIIEKNARFEVEMKVTREKNENIYHLTLWTRERNFVSRTEKPFMQKGQVFLLNNDQCWIYYPTIDKTIKTSKNQRLLGGDISFVDMASINLIGDYTTQLITISSKEARELPFYEESLEEIAKNGYILECLVKEGKNVVYPKVRIFIDKDKRPIRLEFYTLSGHLLGILNYSDYRYLDGKIKACTLIMRTSLKPNNFTTLYYTKAEYDLALPDNYFSVLYMKRLSLGK